MGAETLSTVRAADANRRLAEEFICRYFGVTAADGDAVMALGELLGGNRGQAAVEAPVSAGAATEAAKAPTSAERPGLTPTMYQATLDQIRNDLRELYQLFGTMACTNADDDDIARGVRLVRLIECEVNGLLGRK